jgi:hypothetical protein
LTEYEQGFSDARSSVLELIDEWYEVYQGQVDHMPVKVAIAFLKKAIGDADVEDME